MNDSSILLNAEKGIIVAADVKTIADLRKLAALCSDVPEVVAIKVGFILALSNSLRTVVKAVKEVSDIPLIYDHQKAATDIPEMGKPFAEVCRDAGVQGVIFFPHSGPKTMTAFVSAAFESALIPVVGLVMTHPEYLHSEGGFIVDDAPDRICKLAVDMGVKNFVLPGTKTEMVTKYCQGPLMPIKPVSIMMPGIGAQGGSIANAFNAASGHHQFAIIGSAVYNAPDPKQALRQFALEIKS
jgi:orotidine-5'-phosphate decarboxylase